MAKPSSHCPSQVSSAGGVRGPVKAGMIFEAIVGVVALSGRWIIVERVKGGLGSAIRRGS